MHGNVSIYSCLHHITDRKLAGPGSLLSQSGLDLAIGVEKCLIGKVKFFSHMYNDDEAIMMVFSKRIWKFVVVEAEIGSGAVIPSQWQKVSLMPRNVTQARDPSHSFTVD